MASYVQKLCGAPYGLRNGQLRGRERRVHNGNWFDRKWQKIGWGDLADDDFVRIAKEIPFGDLFVVLASIPLLVPINGDYCIANCTWLVEHGAAYEVIRHADCDGAVVYQRRVRFQPIAHASVRRIVERINRINSR